MHFKSYKTILSHKNGMNLYRGCSHGCIYCDSRSRCYHMDHDFEDIEVKENAAQILEQQLLRKRHKCMVRTGAMTDPYIPLEASLGYTRSCIALIDRLGFGLSIQTKSDLILRDLDLLSSIHQKAKCVVEITLTTLDDKLCSLIEPHVAVTSRRIEVLHRLATLNIPTIVWLSPLLPFINDTEANVRGLLEACVSARVHGIIWFGAGLTLREGNREYFFKQLDLHFPGLKDKYLKAFGNSYVCESPNTEALTQMVKAVCLKHGMLFGMAACFDYIHQFENKEQAGAAEYKQLSLEDFL